MTPKRSAERPLHAHPVEEGDRIGDRLIAIFCLGVVLFSPLVIDIFDRGPRVDVFGLPLLYFYLFAAWAVVIGLLAWVLERPSTEAAESAERVPKDGDREGAL